MFGGHYPSLSCMICCCCSSSGGEQVNSWNAPPSSRTMSQSSGGENGGGGGGSDGGGWSAPVSTPASRTSPLSAGPNQSIDPASWATGNSNGPDMRRTAMSANRWESNPPPPIRANSVSTDVGKSAAGRPTFIFTGEREKVNNSFCR